MPVMWTVSGALTYWIVGGSFWLAMVVGGVLAPVDPVLSESIASGEIARRNVPTSLRHALLAESGANDGLALPLVAVASLLFAQSPGTALRHWALSDVLLGVFGGIALGAVVGYVAGKLVEVARRRETIEEIYFYAFTIAISLLVLGVAGLARVDQLLAVFAAGVAVVVAFDDEDDRVRQEHSQESVNRFFSLPIFVLLGFVLPWDEWARLGWRAPALAAAVLVLRRLPAALALTPLVPRLGSWRGTFFLGWFGPIGVAALYYAASAARETGERAPWVLGTLVICASVLAHGVTAGPLTRLLGRVHPASPRNVDER
jgi:NhaP-type Na+/H+ or K+/H+ antiporter